MSELQSEDVVAKNTHTASPNELMDSAKDNLANQSSTLSHLNVNFDDGKKDYLTPSLADKRNEYLNKISEKDYSFNHKSSKINWSSNTKEIKIKAIPSTSFEPSNNSLQKVGKITTEAIPSTSLGQSTDTQLSVNMSSTHSPELDEFKADVSSIASLINTTQKVNWPSITSPKFDGGELKINTSKITSVEKNNGSRLSIDEISPITPSKDYIPNIKLNIDNSISINTSLEKKLHPKINADIHFDKNNVDSIDNQNKINGFKDDYSARQKQPKAKAFESDGGVDYESGLATSNINRLAIDREPSDIRWKQAKFAFFNPIEALGINGNITSSKNFLSPDLTTIATTFQINLISRHNKVAQELYTKEQLWGDGGKGNAYRHTIFQSLIAQKYGKEIAIDAGDAHETRVLASDLSNIKKWQNTFLIIKMILKWLSFALLKKK
ncbi:hypothetical protein QJU43_05110 [Pasteurella atlantica]|uniref:hypothetical protein n=1 Tax=Pasteurellaceae TaxID=712 RepID=UPI00276D879C|nr:hypothetical protein [Pasteurella atlantica]MDP8034264.1 hypothetical protein [Pasteurella atlantica]MDP8036197.1 hypothetical protein [Pasteurella atlantica]MDP8038147.1 hypothetical protein [Pasteurella atlantica]MDP8048502.1 hypothetical protein [Pasteurella atlantica]MDP8050433.1 hypothetical protein [Pasteurella atlantica]